MSSGTSNNKPNKGGDIVRFEPKGMSLINSNPGYIEIFRKAGCLKFCQNLEGHHIDVTHKFVLNYDGKSSKVGDLMVQVTEKDIAMATGIPAEGERWFKDTTLDLSDCKKFFREEYQDINLTSGAPRKCITDESDEFLKVIQRYFTCEGRFNMVYAYHIRLLMHFDGMRALNIPYFLHISIGNMTDKIQGNPKQFENHIFHHALIKLLIVKEMRKEKEDMGVIF